jgi:hypothetical protein
MDSATVKFAALFNDAYRDLPFSYFRQGVSVWLTSAHLVSDHSL